VNERVYTHIHLRGWFDDYSLIIEPESNLAQPNKRERMRGNVSVCESVLVLKKSKNDG